MIFLHQNVATVWDFLPLFSLWHKRMPISQAISINYFKILLYDYTLALLVICHIVFVLIPHPWNSHQQPIYCNVWHMPSVRVTLVDTEFMPLSYTKSFIKIAYILYYSLKFVSHPFWGQTVHRNTTFCED